MRKILLATVALSAMSATQALAADMVRPAPRLVAAPVIKAFNWTGLYIGIQGGYDWNTAESSAPAAFTIDFDGGILGAYAGYNLQFGNIVLGIDASISKSWANADASTLVAVPNSHIDMNWKGDIRGRLGFAFDRFLVYAAGGAAVADVEVTLGGVSESDTAWGWTAGAGIEYAFTNSLIARVEYKYADYGNLSYSGLGATAGLTSSQALVGLALKF